MVPFPEIVGRGERPLLEMKTDADMLSLSPLLPAYVAGIVADEPTGIVGTVEGRMMEKLGAITLTWKLIECIEVRFCAPLVLTTVTI